MKIFCNQTMFYVYLQLNDFLYFVNCKSTLKVKHKCSFRILQKDNIQSILFNKKSSFFAFINFYRTKIEHYFYVPQSTLITLKANNLVNNIYTGF